MDIGTLTGAIVLEDQLSNQLTGITQRVKEFATSFDGLVGKILIGSTVIVGGITAITGSIIALGMKGSTILGVEEAFDKFAQTVGSDGATMFDAINSGLRGTVDSMEVMQATTKLLSSGVQVTADDMNVLGKSAREMAKATGTDATTSLNQLSMAMQTGNTRALKRMGINIDMAKAEREFATSIGTVRSELSQSGIVQARYNAIQDALRDKLAKSGESALSFKEKIQQANVSIGDWFDNLAKGVAKSSVVSATFDKIKDSFVNVFGGTAESAQKNILKWIDDFATGVARMGPIVIQAFGTVKDWIVKVWNELVAFNDRYQITNTIVAGAKFAWGVLEQAFMLVQKAVRAVIQAWSEMPEWLQKISRTALQASISVAAFGVGIGTVAAPFAAVISKFDLGLNVISNFSVSLNAGLAVWPKITNAMKLAHTAIGVWILDLRTTTAVSNLEILATNSVTLAKQTLTAATNAVTYAYTTMTARIVMSTAYLRAHAAMVYVVQAAQKAWAVSVAFVSTTYTGLITRLGLTTAAMRASSAATLITKGAMELLGFAILGIQAIPLIALVSGLTLGLYKLVDAMGAWNKARGEGKNFWEFLHDTRDYDNWARKALEYIGILEMMDRINPVAPGGDEDAPKKRKRGGAKPNQTFLPTISAGASASGSSEMQAAQKERDEMEKRAQGIGLINDAFIKASTAAEDFTEKIINLGKEWGKTLAGFTDDAAFTAAFKNLTPKQLQNPELQEALVPNIDRLIEGNKTLADGMQEVRFATQQTQIALAAKDKAVLEAYGLTLTQIDGLKRLGLSEQQIAGNYGVSTTALRTRIAALQESAQNESNVQSFLAKGVEQQAAAAARREALAITANQAIGKSYEDLEDLTMKSSMTSTEFQIKQIKKEQVAREVAFAKSISGLADAEQRSKDYHDVQEQLSEQSVRALMFDQNALLVNSKRTQFEQAAYARETYERMARDPENYSKKTIEHFKKIAEAAEREFEGVKTVSERVYSALGHVATILDNIPGLFAEIGSMAARTGMAMIEAFGSGDWIGGIIAGVTGAIGIFTKLFTKMREGRHLVVEFAESFDTAAVGTGFDELHKKLNALGEAGEQMWIQLTQRTKAGDKVGAQRIIDQISEALENSPEALASSAGYKTKDELQQIADKAKAVYEYMVSSGKYTAESIADAFKKSKDAQIDAMGDAAKAISERYTEMFEKLDEEHKSLTASVAQEAEEEVMGVIEMQQRARIAEIEAERKALEEKQAMEMSAADKTYQAWLEAGKTTDDALRALFERPYEIPVRWKVSGMPGSPSEEAEEPSYMAGGGDVAWRPRGSDSVPAMLTPGERVLSRHEAGAYEGGGGGTAILEVDGQVIARVAVPHMRKETRRYGLSRR